MSRFRSILLALLLLGARPAAAVFQCYILVDELEQLSCWNNDCTPVEAWISLADCYDPDLHVTVSPGIFLGGSPQAYVFTLDDNGMCDSPEDCWYIDTIHLDFAGPGFHYLIERTPGLINPCFSDLPYQIHVSPDDGCVDQDPDFPCGYHLTRECYPSGQVTVTQDFTIPADTTLIIDAGLELYALPGVTLTVEGRIEANGTDEAWITFHGNHWGGIVLTNGAEATLDHCIIRDVDSPSNGGALTVGSGAVVHLDNCLIDHNTTAGAGGAAHIADGGALMMYRCTVSHNTGTQAGIFLGGGSAFLEANMSLLTFNEPANSEVTGAGVANVLFTDVYPQSAGFPPGMATPDRHCNPGYVDADNFDFHISYWSTTDPTQVSCCIDVGEVDLDPDGTWGDLGAFPFDQHQLLNPPRDLVVADRPNDEGGFVLLSFTASSNEGGPLNPVAYYSIWVRQPGMGPDQWLAAGTVVASNNPAARYTVQLATLDDRWEGHDNTHLFRVAAHCPAFGAPAWAPEVEGFSLDYMPPAVTGLNLQIEMLVEVAQIVITVDPSPSQYFDHFQALFGFTSDVGQALPLLDFASVQGVASLHLADLLGHSRLHVWVRALDHYGNVGPTAYEFTDFTLAVAPARSLQVTDVPGDQGGWVRVWFHASPNEGDTPLQITQYVIFTRQPGDPPDQWTPISSVDPQHDPDRFYQVLVQTQDDQYSGHPYQIAFLVRTWFSGDEYYMDTPVVLAHSSDNLAPPLLTGLDASDGWYWLEEPHQVDRLDLAWNASAAEDLLRYELRYTINDVDVSHAVAVPSYEGDSTRATLALPHGQLRVGDWARIWVRAVDVHLNNGNWMDTGRVFEDAAVDPGPVATFLLAPAAPNPFNPSTRIAYELASSGPVRLEVFNLAGECVALLVDGSRPAGRHSVTFDGAGLASGVYVCRLEAPGFSDVKKMVLVK